MINRLGVLWVSVLVVVLFCPHGLHASANIYRLPGTEIGICGGISHNTPEPEQKNALDPASWLREFYMVYISTCDSPSSYRKTDSLRRRYLTSRFYGELRYDELDFDPVIDAHDCSAQWIETLTVDPDPETDGIYIVRYSDGFSTRKIMVGVVADNDGYRIDRIKLPYYDNEQFRQ